MIKIYTSNGIVYTIEHNDRVFSNSLNKNYLEIIDNTGKTVGHISQDGSIVDNYGNLTISASLTSKT